MNGTTLKRLMRFKGFTNNDMAQRLGTTAQNLSALLAKDDIRTSLLEQMCEVMGISPAELYGGPAIPPVNITDLHALRPCDYADGRIRYRRAKTGRAYDIKVEPEAAALIEQYRGQQHLLSFADRYRSARDYTQHINAGLKRLLPDPPFTSLSTYWARHTWATLAFNELSASTDDISAALGHKHGSRITAIYINPDSRKVDALNRRMLDLIFAL